MSNKLTTRNKIKLAKDLFDKKLIDEQNNNFDYKKPCRTGSAYLVKDWTKDKNIADRVEAYYCFKCGRPIKNNPNGGGGALHWVHILDKKELKEHIY